MPTSDVATVRPGRAVRALLALVAVVAVIAATAVPFAPVWSSQTTVSWPVAGRDPVSSTAFLSPYQPAELHVTVPCGVLRAAPKSGRQLVFSTTPPASSSTGATVTLVDGQAQVTLGGRLVAQGPADASEGCGVTIDAADSGTAVRIGGQTWSVPGQPVTEMSTFATGLAPAAARGLTATARARVYAETAPHSTKLALIGAWALLALGCLVLLGWSGPAVARERAPRRVPGERRWVNGLIDAGVLAALAAWGVIGPGVWDDGWALITATNADHSGAITNYHTQQNTSEMFVLSQWVVWAFAQVSQALVWLRLPIVVMAAILWFVLSRGVLGSLLPGTARRWPVRLTAAVALLAWWMPYCLALRFEPFVALLVTGVLALVLRGTAQPARRGLVWLGLAAVLTGLAAAVTPSGLLAAIAVWLVLCARVWRRLTDGQGWRRWPDLVARTFALTALASVFAVVTFAGQSWHGMLRAVEQHNTGSMPNLPWFAEATRYTYLFGAYNYGATTGRRVPILITLALLAVAALWLARGARAVPGGNSLLVMAPVFLGGTAALAFTPSKWTHHFGSLAGVGAALVVCSVVTIHQAARRWPDDRRARAIGLAGGGMVAIAASLAFAGQNTWVSYSQFGLPWQDGPLRPFDSPLFWVVLVAAGYGCLRLLGRAGKVSPGRAPAALVATPAVLATVALSASVLALLAMFAVAPLKQRAAGGYSAGLDNARNLIGHETCGLADKVEVYPDIPDSSLRPAGREAATQTGFVAAGGWASQPPGPSTVDGVTTVWGSLAGGITGSTGTLTSPWYRLPALARDQRIGLWTAGRTGDGNRLALEFGINSATGVTALGERVLDDAAIDAALRTPDYGQATKQRRLPQNHPAWRTLLVEPGEVPAGADRVRVRAVDATTDAGGWIAVTGPRVVRATSLTTFLGETGGTVLMGPLMTAYMPCVTMPAAARGLASGPAVTLTLGFPYTWQENGFPFEVWDPPLAGLPAVAKAQEIPSRLLGAGDEPMQLLWGRVSVLKYEMEQDSYTATTRRVRQWGWQGDA